MERVTRFRTHLLSAQPDHQTRRAICLPTEAQQVVQELVKTRKKQKMSFTRASNIGREINELIKVLMFYIPNEN